MRLGAVARRNAYFETGRPRSGTNRVPATPPSTAPTGPASHARLTANPAFQPQPSAERPGSGRLPPLLVGGVGLAGAYSTALVHFGQGAFAVGLGLTVVSAVQYTIAFVRIYERHARQ